MSTTDFAKDLFDYQMTIAMNKAKCKLEKELFYEEAIKKMGPFLMCLYWPDSLRESERETVLQTHRSLINYNIYRIYSRNVKLYLTSPISDGGTS